MISFRALRSLLSRPRPEPTLQELDPEHVGTLTFLDDGPVIGFPRNAPAAVRDIVRRDLELWMDRPQGTPLVLPFPVVVVDDRSTIALRELAE